MELLARHTVDNRGTVRPGRGRAVACRTAARAALLGGGPDGQVLRAHQRPCRRAGLPDPLPVRRLPALRVRPSYLPELRAYADELRKEREAMLAAGAAEWAVGHVGRQLEVIVGHVRTHEALLERLADRRAAAVEEASSHAAQGPPVRSRRLRAPEGGRWLTTAPPCERARRQDSTPSASGQPTPSRP